ncbi:MAG: GNAT family N-acetyltransferase [Planctomycetota bacterium]|jgi:GNAT superfamily N-acetyltransferase
MTEASIRSARLEDAGRIADWQVAMAMETEGRPLDRQRVGRGVSRALQDPARGRYLVVEDDGEAVGSLLLTREWSDWRDGWFWWIQSVYLEPRARGKGHYGRLYAHVVEEARADPDVRGVRLYVETENEHARRVYTALGMPETSYRLHELDFDA